MQNPGLPLCARHNPCRKSFGSRKQPSSGRSWGLKKTEGVTSKTHTTAFPPLSVDFTFWGPARYSHPRTCFAFTRGPIGALMSDPIVAKLSFGDTQKKQGPNRNEVDEVQVQIASCRPGSVKLHIASCTQQTVRLLGCTLSFCVSRLGPTISNCEIVG